MGGAHPGLGTRNALLSLGDERYLELIAPDPGQTVLTWFRGIETIPEPRLVGWAARTRDIDALAERLRAHRIGFSGPSSGSRVRADGVVLRWRTLTLDDDAAGVLPFFIEWSSETVHPSRDTPHGCVLDSFRVQGLDVAALKARMDLLGLDPPVDSARTPGCTAIVRGVNGRRWELRG